MSAQGSPAGSEAARRAALISSRAALMSAQRCQAPWQPCADILAALRCHRGSPALPSRQPCAALLAALRCHRGSPAGSPDAIQGCPAGSAALLSGQPCSKSRQPCGQPR